jgi:hypothetical protein
MSFAAMFANVAILTSIVVILTAAFIQMAHKWGGDDSHHPEPPHGKKEPFAIDWWIVPEYPPTHSPTHSPMSFVRLIVVVL